jgi:hypothetical protein
MQLLLETIFQSILKSIVQMRRQKLSTNKPANRPAR